MNHKILGRDWEDIQAAQQGDSSAINKLLHGPATRPSATDADHELLAKYGKAKLQEMGFFGVLDRLSIQ